MAAASDGYVVLRGGLSLPLAPVLLALELEARGFALTLDGDALLVQPGSKLTQEDAARIRRWKRHLLAVLTYESPYWD